MINLKPLTLITGSSSGLGLALANCLSKNTRLWLHGRNQEKVTQLSENLNPHLKTCYNLSETENIETFWKPLLEENIPDVVILNAGFGQFKLTEDIPANHFNEIWKVNVLANQLLLNLIVPLMKARKSGLIIGILSDAARKNFAFGSAYNPTKSAMASYLAAVRHEVQPFGIRVTCLFPGLINTNFGDANIEDYKDSDRMNPMVVAKLISYIIEQPSDLVVDEIMLRPINQPPI